MSWRGWLLSLIVLLSGVLVGPHQAQLYAAVPAATLTYEPTAASFANPERGFHHYIETRVSNPARYDLAELTRFRTDEQITLLYCIHYLDGLTAAPIPGSFLTHIQANLDTVRQAGLKCILRFAYTDADPTLTGEEPPFGDAPAAQVTAHLDQLAPLLQANSDVIALLQAGFIGVWGEWYYTDHFVADPATPWEISPAMHAARRQILEQILSILPPARVTALRYPHGKQAMFGTTVPLTPTQAFDGSSQARTAFHNDCFLADETDYGTYREEQLAADKAYLAQETAFLPMGGETCNPNPPRSSCATALAELARFHWSYLNTDFHPEVLAGWADEGCLMTMQQRLGYRLVLKQSTLPAAVMAGGALAGEIILENEGFAAPFNPRPVWLVLRNQATGARTSFDLPADLRRWLPGSEHALALAVSLPAALPAGQYELLLHLPDAAPALAERPEYAIQLANQGIWEADTGYNRLLHTVTVLPQQRLYLPYATR